MTGPYGLLHLPPPPSPLSEKEWRVRTYPVGNSVHVYPSRGLLQIDNWEHAAFLAPWWIKATLVGWFLWCFIGDFSLIYPKNERQLRRAIRCCEAFCRRENEREAIGKRLAEKV